MEMIDPRVVRTNERLRQALHQLLQEQSLKQISVQKLTQSAQLTRGTFYLHYKDKADFLTQTEDQVVNEWFTAAKVTLAPNGEPVAGFALAPALRYIESHRHIVSVLLGPDFGRFRPHLRERFEHELMGYSRQLTPQLANLPPKDIQVTFLVTAFLGLVQQWLDDDLRYRPEFLARAFRQMISPELRPLAGWFSLVGLDVDSISEKS
ncbi:transcriptional regulator [Levilactobacillus senmaizukei DSM 21775 = NBRC 103853]|uniref:Transcriptional regulator n=1 Tax=Levilactobacillus senmaizukei DSM 21775 = NBRC 103853 TaxID=1423803 RepID=A0A0R2DLX2_9LACO|nr:TetR/AcrR family transcriptional regulator [Levilactobacillus senmaizukei]KRN01703.1 transcriptional regulator [Levilactobacillus senmaizukei DSM 21775 = NBRC 103853]